MTHTNRHTLERNKQKQEIKNTRGEERRDEIDQSIDSFIQYSTPHIIIQRSCIKRSLTVPCTLVSASVA